MKLEKVNFTVKITHNFKINFGNILVKVADFTAMRSYVQYMNATIRDAYKITKKSFAQSPGIKGFGFKYDLSPQSVLRLRVPGVIPPFPDTGFLRAA
jgi:hypothetical protein